MTRKLARIAFIGTILASVVTTCIVVANHWLEKPWGSGLGGGFGALAINFSGRWFDRIWPKPKAGWSE